MCNFVQTNDCILENKWFWLCSMIRAASHKYYRQLKRLKAFQTQVVDSSDAHTYTHARGGLFAPWNTKK